MKVPIQLSSYYLLFFFLRNSPKNNLQRNLAKEQEVRKVFLVKRGKMVLHFLQLPHSPMTLSPFSYTPMYLSFTHANSFGESYNTLGESHADLKIKWDHQKPHLMYTLTLTKFWTVAPLNRRQSVFLHSYLDIHISQQRWDWSICLF